MDGNGTDGSEWDQEDNELRQEQLDTLTAHNDVVTCQMKLRQNEYE